MEQVSRLGSLLRESGAAEGHFSEAVEAIYDAAVQPALWPEALQAIANVFDDVGAVMLWQRDDGGFGVIASPSLDAAQRDYEENGWHLRDTRSIRAVRDSLWLREDAVTERHFISHREMDADPFYNSFLERHGLRWCAAIGIAPDSHVSAGLAIQRLKTKDPYSDQELAVAKRLGHHTEKALRLSIRLFDAELSKIGLGEALARLDIGVFALDSLKRVVFANPAAQRMLGDGLALVNDRLMPHASSDRVALDTAIESMLSSSYSSVQDLSPILIHRGSSRPLVAYVLSVRTPAHPAEQFLIHTRIIVLSLDPESGGPLDPTLVRDILGLTLGEARVAALIGSGLSPRDAAAELGIAEETARTVLKRIFWKVGVARQSELTALLTKLVLR